MPIQSSLWKPGRNFLGRRFFGFTIYETYEKITPTSRFGQIEGFDQELADEIRKVLIDRFGMNGTPPPRPNPQETVDSWLIRLERWFFHHHIDVREADAGLDVE